MDMNMEQEPYHLVDIIKLELEGSRVVSDNKECSVCRSRFNFLFNKKFVCKDCSVSLCRSCAIWDAALTCWLCKHCYNKRELRRRAGGSLYTNSKFKGISQKKKGESDSENDSGYGAGGMHSLTSPASTTSGLDEETNRFSLDSTEVDPTTAEVRDHIETLIEGMIDGALDTASITRLYNHLQYDEMFTTYRDQLTEILAQLAYSLHMAINQQPLSDNDVPTTVHSMLTRTIKQILSDAKLLPDLAEFLATPSTNSKNEEQMLSSQTYEDILSVAIINKVIEKSQEDLYGPLELSLLPVKMSESEDTNHTDTDDEKDLYPPTPKPRKRIDGIVDDWKLLAAADSSDGTDIDEDFTWCTPTDNDFMMEEEIEITTYEQDAETEEKLEPIVKRAPSSDFGYLYSSLDLFESPKVAFPEWGRELTNASSDDPEEDGLKSSTSVDTWEDNWLFQRKRLKHSRSGLLGPDPVPMLVPNPEEDVRVKIGDRDMEELSDLSEGSYRSAEALSDEEEPSTLIEAISPNVPPPQTFWPKGESVNELVQKDVEYTEHVEGLDKVTLVSSPNVSKKVPKPRKFSNHPRFVLSSERSKDSGDDPRFVRLPSEALNIHTHAGRAVRLICKVQGTPPLDVWWYRGGEALLPDERVIVLSNGCEHQLHLYDTEKRDSTTYSCLVSNNKGQAWQDFKIYFKESSRAENVPDFVSGLSDVSGFVGRSVKFECTITGYPEPQVKFYKQDTQLLPGENCSIEFLGYGMWVVILKHLKLSDAGEYKVFAQNRLGRTSSSANLTVTQAFLQDTPELPTQSVNQTPKKVVRKQKRMSEETVREIEQSLECNKTVRKEEISPQPPQPGSDLSHEGTIAEREHRKWSEQAIKLDNNPYSAENLKKRMQFGKKSSYQNILAKSQQDSSYAEFDSDNENQTEGVNDNGSKIYCGLKSIDANKYQRDYYVKGGRENIVNNRYQLKQKTSDPTFNSSFLHPASEVQRKSFALGDRIAKFETDVQSNHDRGMIKATSVTNLNATPQTSYVNHVKKEDQRLRTPTITNQDKKWVSCENLTRVEIRSSKDEQVFISGQNNNSSADGEPLKLPSVKQLANKFSPILRDSSEKKQEAALENENIVIINKEDTHTKLPKFKNQKSRHNNIYEVHSLTARSVPKEFREAMRQQLPQPHNRNITVVRQRKVSSGSEEERSTPSPENMGIPSKLCNVQPQRPVYTSDDSTTSQGSAETKPRRKLTKSIATRAAFWDKRVQKGLISDKDVDDMV